MEWILNELSLERRFNSVDDFLCYLVELFKVKNSHPNLIDRFLCPRNIGNIQVVADKTFAQLVMQDVPKDLKTGILSWINKTGPFWCDDRAENQDDYFEHNDVDVTDRGLGECARRVIVGSSISAFSVNGQSFDYSPITINH